MIVQDFNMKDWSADNFKPYELERESENNMVMYNSKLQDTLDLLDNLREELGQPIIITDACRWSGSKTSQHYYEQFNALDIWVKGYTSEELMKEIEKRDMGTGRGLYPFNNGFIHLDCRRGKSSDDGRVSRWYRDGSGNYHTCDDGTFNGLID